MMIRRNRFLLTSLALIGFTTTAALADEWNKEMILRISEPVEVPGQVLQPGKYVFRLADSSSNRNIVQIFSEDDYGRQHFIATIFAVPDYRLTTPDKPIVLFEERHVGSPEAIKSWFYPGAKTGWHFVYPKSEQLQVAASPAAPPPTPTPVPVETLPEPPPPAVAEAVEPAPLFIVEKESVVEQVVFAAPPAEGSEPGADRLLPETGGHSAMILLAGITILASGLAALSISRRKVQSEGLR